MKENEDRHPNISPIKSPDRRAVAVALKGRFAESGDSGDSGDSRPDSLPKVVASGYGALAEQILAMAFDKGVRVREDADLAELLAILDLDTPIPSEALVAVAEILSKVYEANAHVASDASSPTLC